MTEEKIFLVKCKREEIINRPTIKFVELTKRELDFIKNELRFLLAYKAMWEKNKIAKTLLKKLEEIGDKK